MPNLAEIREQYPQYKDMDDKSLADALYKKYYSDWPRQKFDMEIGYTPEGMTPLASEGKLGKPMTLSGLAPDFDIGRAKAAGKGFLSGFLGNMSDEATAALTATVGRKPGGGLFDVGNFDKPWSARYDENLEAERASQQQAATDYPVTTGVSNVAGAVANPVFRRMPAKGFLQGAASGGAIGATYGFGAGEGAQDRLEKMLFTGALGAGTGGVTGMAAKLLGNKTQPAQTVDDLRQQASTAWQSMEQAGVLVDQAAWQRFGQNVQQLMAQKHINPSIHPKAFAALQELTKQLQGHPTLQTIHQMRQVLGDVLASGDKADRRLASMMMERLDDFIDNIVPSQSIAGAGRQGADAMREGIELSKRLFKADDIQRLVEKAKLDAGVNYTNAGFQTALKRNFKNLMLNEKRFRKFSAAEQMAIRKIVSGGLTEDVLRYIGKYAPTSPLALFTGAGVPMLFGLPAELAFPLSAGIGTGGTAAREMSSRMTQGAVRNALGTAIQGGPMVKSFNLSPTQQALLESALVVPPALASRQKVPVNTGR